MEVQAESTLCLINGIHIDGTGNPPVKDSRIFVRGERIESAGTAEHIEIPEGSMVIDAQGMTIMPGLIDAHTHLNTPLVPEGQNLMLEILKTSPTMAVFYCYRNAMESLLSGFTTLRDLAGYGIRNNEENVALRRAISMGLIMGPRVLAAGPVNATAGHIDMAFVSRATPWVPSNRDCADGVWEVRKRVRSLIRHDVDLIKVFASGWAGDVEAAWWRNFTLDEMEAIVDEAHAHGLKVAVHVASPETMKLALRAGADTIEHLIDIDDEALDLLCGKEAYLIPTLGLFSDKALERRARHQSAEIVRRVRRARETTWKAFQKCIERGVRIALGTDTCRTRVHGENADELAIMNEAGMTPMNVLVAATRNSAEACGLAEEVGTIEPGKMADILIVEGDPLADLRILQDRSKIRKVIKSGRVVVER